jgi:class 3 adenylate cyclase
MPRENPEDNRNWLISVLFIDIVGYSKAPVDDQMEMKLVLNSAITASITDIRVDDRVILDTGDGAAVCFLADPEHALRSALSIRETIEKSNRRGSYPIVARMGLNLGPVKLVKDLNGVLNAVGDGINVGQRVMSFAADGELTASRAFMEVVACLRDDYPQLFKYQGPRKDKHGREHIIYNVARPAEGGKGSGAPIEISDEDLADYSRGLAAFVGPIAKVLAKRSSIGVTKHIELVERLSKEVSEGPERAAFIAKVTPLATKRDALLAATPSDQPIQETLAASYCPTLLDSTVIADAERALAVYIGPVAKVLTKRTANETKSVKEFFDALAQHISDTGDREQFLRAVQIR